MREILFRGKRTDNDEWIKGYLHKTDGVGKGYRAFAIQVQDIDSYMCRPHSHEVQPKTVGQYTGLTDKNGKKIFEGDIIQGTITSRWDKSLIRCEIVYKGDCFLAIEKISNTLWEHKIRFAKDIEVIGNIHDNTELLEKDNA